LKLHPPLVFFVFPKVLEQNPPKQGLKLVSVRSYPYAVIVLEQNPPKQGLKHAGTTKVRKADATF